MTKCEALRIITANYTQDEKLELGKMLRIMCTDMSYCDYCVSDGQCEYCNYKRLCADREDFWREIMREVQ